MMSMSPLHRFIFWLLLWVGNVEAWLSAQQSPPCRIPTHKYNVGISTKLFNAYSSNSRKLQHELQASISSADHEEGAKEQHQQSHTINSKIRSLIQFLLHQIRRLLWPGLTKNFDPSLDAPLPENASLGCPFFGSNILAGSKAKGPESFYSQASAKLGHPRIWRFYFMGSPITSVSGADNVKAVLQSKEFNIVPLDSAFDSSSSKQTSESQKSKKKKAKVALFSSNSVMFEQDRQRHQFLRQLIGAAFTPHAVEEGMANILQAATQQLSKLGNDKTLNLEDICDSFTQDIAWRQIIGLDLQGKEEEIQRFQKAVKVYVSGVFSMSAYLNFPWNKLLPPFRARKYLVEKIEERIAYLEKHGPDGTTLSAMVFSSDEQDSKKKLTHEDIAENALILLIAGTETTGSTLTSAVSFLGLHPHIFENLKEEQRRLISIHGEKQLFSKEFLDESIYLEAVISETMRVVPISGTNFRRAEKAIILDGKQIPEGENVFCNIRLTHELDPRIISSSSSNKSMDPVTSFVPERWLDPETKPKEDFLPFGMGSRRCLGAPLAMAEMRVFLSILARRVDKFELVGGGFEKRRIRWNPASLVPKPTGDVAMNATLSKNNV